MDLSKLRTFIQQRSIIKRRQPTERQKIFANYISGKGPYPEYEKKKIFATQQQSSEQYNFKKNGET